MNYSKLEAEYNKIADLEPVNTRHTAKRLGVLYTRLQPFFYTDEYVPVTRGWQIKKSTLENVFHNNLELVIDKFGLRKELRYYVPKKPFDFIPFHEEMMKKGFKSTARNMANELQKKGVIVRVAGNIWVRKEVLKAMSRQEIDEMYRMASNG